MAIRDELYEAVWSEPLIKLAKRFDVSGNYLARVCDYAFRALVGVIGQKRRSEKPPSDSSFSGRVRTAD